MRFKIQLIFILLLLPATLLYAADRRFTLVIDAGHGGHDAGALGSISKEKNINLNVALAFGQLVERNCPDVKVIYTRKSDVFVPLHERADIANRNKADLFISIHTNALPGGAIARGMETYTLGMHRAKDNLDVAKRENSVILVEKDYKQHYEGFDPKSSESYIMFEFVQDKNMAKSVELAKQVQSNVCAVAARPDKGVRQAGFLVLRETSMPSCLIELGFITTPDEEQLLNNPGKINAIAQGIYQAFMKYRSKYDTKVTIPFVPPRSNKKLDVGSIVPPTIENKNGKASEQNVKQQAVNIAKDTPQETNEMPLNTSEQQSVQQANKADTIPVFKVQIMAGGTVLKAGSPLFKGVEQVESFEENGMIKYTVGNTTNYNEADQLRRSLSDKFPAAFVIAFKGGEKMNIVQAIREYKANKKK